MHFFEAMERKINYQKEYNKIEEMVVNERHHTGYYGSLSIEEAIEREFRKWGKRGNYTSFKELREQLGFSYQILQYGAQFALGINMTRFFLYCEMLLNIIVDLKITELYGWDDPVVAIVKTMQSDIENSGFEIKVLEEGIYIVEKNAVAIEAADIEPDISDVIVEYNHYLLKGNIDRKKEILRKIADALEPERKQLESICSRETDDFFFMVNNMNVRHNNCEEKDSKNYCKPFAVLIDEEKEKWYDKIYEQALSLIIYKRQKEITSEIERFKKAL